MINHTIIYCHFDHINIICSIIKIKITQVMALQAASEASIHRRPARFLWLLQYLHAQVKSYRLHAHGELLRYRIRMHTHAKSIHSKSEDSGIYYPAKKFELSATAPLLEKLRSRRRFRSLKSLIIRNGGWDCSTACFVSDLPC